MRGTGLRLDGAGRPGRAGQPLQLLIPVAYQVLQNAGPLPAPRCPADPFPFGAWPVPADGVAMVIPCCGRRRRSGGGYRELTRCCRPADSPDLVPGGDVAMGSASMARGGRRRPERAWPSPAAADPGHAPRERTRYCWANRIGHQRGKLPRCCSMASAGELDALLQPAPPISWRVPRAHPVLQGLPAARIRYQGETWPRGSASMARGGRRRPGRAWPVPAAE